MSVHPINGSQLWIRFSEEVLEEVPEEICDDWPDSTFSAAFGACGKIFTPMAHAASEVNASNQIKSFAPSVALKVAKL
jgi:hypothetical protein